MNKHLASRPILLSALLLSAMLAAAGQVAAAPATSPVALSPGGLHFEEAASDCPTFSWTTDPRAAGYELVVYLMSDEGSAVDDEPLLRLALPAGASSWTPSAERCLTPGGSFAWLVRTLGADELEPWSEAKLFRVAARPTELEVGRAVEVLQRYLAAGGSGVEAVRPQVGTPTSPKRDAAALRPLAEAVASLGSGPSAIRGERPETGGAAFGLVGVVNTAEGAALAGDNTAGGADLLLAGATSAAVTENRWELDSATPQVFSFDNPSGDLTLMVDGLEVLAGTIGTSEIEDGTLLFADLAQNSCSSGHVPQWNGSAWVCATVTGGGDADTLDGIDSTSFLRSDTSDTFASGILTFGSGTTLDTTSATLEVGAMTKVGTDVVTNLNADLLDGQEATSFAPTAHSHFGASWTGSSTSPGLHVANDGDTAIQGHTSSTLNDAGVLGRSDNDSSKGVWGINTSTTGSAVGVFGDVLADQGSGVIGLARSTLGSATGVLGQSQATSGTGVYGWATSGDGGTAGVIGLSASATGLGGFFDNTSASGLALGAGGSQSNPAFTVDQSGNVEAASFTGDGSTLTGVVATDADTVDGIHASGTPTANTLLALDGSGKLPASITGDADTVDGFHASAFAGAGHDHFGESWSGSIGAPGLELVNGGPVALRAESFSTSGEAIRAEATATSGDTWAVFAQVDSSAGIGVHGFASATAGGTTGVHGETLSSSGRGVFGWSSNPTGITYGVYGQSDSVSGRAVYGRSTATDGQAYGVFAEVSSTQGFGVRARALSGTGINYGVFGDTASPAGFGGLFVNTGGGILLAANDTLSSSDLEFQVATDGTVTATAYVGDGSGLTNVSAADADTLDGVDSASFLRSDTSDGYTAGTLTFGSGTMLDVSPATLVAGDMVKFGTTLVSNLNADLLDGHHASAFSTTAHNHFGQTWSGSASNGLKIHNSSTGAGASALFGHSTATTGSTFGVIGQTDSSTGTGVYGNSATAGATGVHGQVAAGSGLSIGVQGETASASGYGGLFLTSASGSALAAGTSSLSPQFRVDSAGGVFAGSVRPRTDNSFSLGASGARWTAVWAVNGTIQNSDLRLKEEVTDLDYGLKELLALRPVSFRWKDGSGGRNLGFVAQETRNVVPEVVVEGDDPQHHLGMAYGELTPLLVKAIQDQHREMKRLAGRLAELESSSREVCD